MILTDRTINILKRFSKINDSIVLKEGGLLNTLSEDKSMYAEAKISEEIPFEIPIQRLKDFINLITMMHSSFVTKIEFKEDHCVIQSGDNILNYKYDNKDFIIYPKNQPKVNSPELVFRVQWKSGLKNIITTLNALKYPNVSIKCEDGKVQFSNSDDSQTHPFSFPIVDSDISVKSSKKIDYIMSLDHFKVLSSSDYEVSIYPERIVRFKNEDEEIDYYLIANKGSNIE